MRAFNCVLMRYDGLMNIKYIRVSRRTLIISAIVSVIVLIAVIRVVNQLGKKNAKTASAEQALVIKVETVAKGQVVEQVKISGTIRPINEVEIFPKIAGRIEAIKVEPGDNVKAGDVLAVIEHKEIGLQEKSARASLAIAKASENAAKIDLERGRELYGEGVIAKVELEGYELKYDTAKAQRLNASAQTDIVSQRLKDAWVTSPIKGTVAKKMVDVGTSVAEAMPIFSIQDLSKLKLVTTVDAETLSQLTKGSAVLLKIDYPPLTIKGKVAMLSPSLDPHSRRAAIEIDIEEHNKNVIPNMFVDGTVELKNLQNVLTVPNKALFLLHGKNAVYRIKDGKAWAVTPNLGQRDDINSIVLEGLNESDVVAVSGLDRLHDGSLVITEEAAQ